MRRGWRSEDSSIWDAFLWFLRNINWSSDGIKPIISEPWKEKFVKEKRLKIVFERMFSFSFFNSRLLFQKQGGWHVGELLEMRKFATELISHFELVDSKKFLTEAMKTAWLSSGVRHTCKLETPRRGLKSVNIKRWIKVKISKVKKDELIWTNLISEFKLVNLYGWTLIKINYFRGASNCDEAQTVH
jgi:hypothetical protein